MKLYKKLFLILAVGAGTSSCLDLDSQDQLSDGNMWQSASDLSILPTPFMVGHAILRLSSVMLLTQTGARI